MAKPSTASTNDSAKSLGLELRRNSGFEMKLDDLHTETRTRLPVEVEVSVFQTLPFCTQLIQIQTLPGSEKASDNRYEGLGTIRTCPLVVLAVVRYTRGKHA